MKNVNLKKQELICCLKYEILKLLKLNELIKATVYSFYHFIYCSFNRMKHLSVKQTNILYNVCIQVCFVGLIKQHWSRLCVQWECVLIPLSQNSLLQAPLIRLFHGSSETQQRFHRSIDLRWY